MQINFTEEQQAFAKRLIQLRRMTRQPQRITGKHHRPRDMRWPAPELAVDKISQAPEEESLRSPECKRVGDGPERSVITAREDDACDPHPQDGSVKGEATFPDGDRVQRMRLVLREIVNENVNEPRADEHSRQQIDDKRIHRAFGDGNESTPYAALGDANADRVAHQVHDAVPAEGEWTDPEKLRADVGIGNRQGVSLISRAPNGRAKLELLAERSAATLLVV